MQSEDTDPKQFAGLIIGSGLLQGDKLTSGGGGGGGGGGVAREDFLLNRHSRMYGLSRSVVFKEGRG